MNFMNSYITLSTYEFISFFHSRLKPRSMQFLYPAIIIPGLVLSPTHGKTSWTIMKNLSILASYTTPAALLQTFGGVWNLETSRLRLFCSITYILSIIPLKILCCLIQQCRSSRHHLRVWVFILTCSENPPSSILVCYWFLGDVNSVWLFPRSSLVACSCSFQENSSFWETYCYASA